MIAHSMPTKMGARKANSITACPLRSAAAARRRRSAAILGTGLGFLVGGGSLAAVLGIGSAAMGPTAGALGLSPDALNVIYEQLVGNMTQTALVLALLGLLIAILGWVMGRSGAAQGFRRTIRGLNASARRQLDARGLHTGAFGTWLGRQRVLVRSLLVPALAYDIGPRIWWPSRLERPGNDAAARDGIPSSLPAENEEAGVR